MKLLEDNREANRGDETRSRSGSREKETEQKRITVEAKKRIRGRNEQVKIWIGDIPSNPIARMVQILSAKAYIYGLMWPSSQLAP